MGLLDSVIGALAQGQGGARGGQGDLLNLVLGMLAQNAPGGGLIVEIVLPGTAKASP